MVVEEVQDDVSPYDAGRNGMVHLQKTGTDGHTRTVVLPDSSAVVAVEVVHLAVEAEAATQSYPLHPKHSALQWSSSDSPPPPAETAAETAAVLTLLILLEALEGQIRLTAATRDCCGPRETRGHE